MKYTISFDASVKIKKNDIKGYLNHCARDTLDKDLNHKNKNINKALTDNNITLYNTGDDFEDCDSVEQIEDYINHRLTSVKKKLRKDAVIMRPLLLQLDPAYTDTHNEEEVMTQASNMMDWVVDTFGRDNIAFLSVHRDETNPHIHVGFMPVTDDGRLAQKDWFKNPQALRKMHDDLRDHMITNGYDATKERISGARKRLTDEEYKAFKGSEKKLKEIAEREEAVDIRYRNVVHREHKLRESEEELFNKEQSINSREKALKSDLNAYNARMINLKQREDEYERKKEQLTEDLQADYYNATEHLEHMIDVIADKKAQYDALYNKGLYNLSDTSLGNIRSALMDEYGVSKALEITKYIEGHALSSADRARIESAREIDNKYDSHRSDVNVTIHNRKKRRPLSEGLDWSGYDKDDYDFSL